MLRTSREAWGSPRRDGAKVGQPQNIGPETQYQSVASDLADGSRIAEFGLTSAQIDLSDVVHFAARMDVFAAAAIDVDGIAYDGIARLGQGHGDGRRRTRSRADAAQ